MQNAHKGHPAPDRHGGGGSQSSPSRTASTVTQGHRTRNGTKTALDYSYGSQSEIWWQCPTFKSHVWRARIASRTSMLTGCSLCARLAGKGRRVRADAEDNAVA